MKITGRFKHLVLLTTLLQVGSVILAQSAAFGQSANINKREPSVAVEITSKPDCSLIVTPAGFDTSYEGKLVINFIIKNVGEKKVRAFIISHRISDSSSEGSLEFLSPLATGQTLNAWEAELKTNLKSNSTISLSVDYILFADGTSWGNSSKRESDFINGYVEGQKQMLTKLKMMAKTDKSALSKLLEQEDFNVDRSRIDKTKTEEWKIGYVIGYKSVWIELIPIYKKLGIEMLPLETDEFHGSTEPIWIAY